MNRTLLVVIAIMVNSTLAVAQWQLARIVLLENIDQVASDPNKNLYLSRSNGDLLKYDKEGDLLLEYSPSKSGKIHSIDASSQLKVVLFYKGLQEYIILDRYLSKAAIYRLADHDLGFVTEVVVNRQQNLWVIDVMDFALKFIDTYRNELLESKSLAQVLAKDLSNITSFKFYQGKMYLVDKHLGMLVFDNIGNYLSKIDIGKGEVYGFYRDALVQLDAKRLKLTNLYSLQKEFVPLPHTNFSNVLYFGDQLVLITSQGFEIYKYLSAK